MFLFPLLVLFATYGLVIFCCKEILRLLAVSAQWRILLSFMIFGVATGLLTVWDWPRDIILVYNFPAAMLGDEIYQWSIHLMGDPTSSNAHETIPWLLRIPQVMLLASVAIWGLLGTLIQFAVRRPRTAPGIPRR